MDVNDRVVSILRHGLFATESDISFTPMCQTAETLDPLELPQMVSSNDSCYQTAFSVKIDARDGIMTGVSAKDRVCEIRAAITRKQKNDI